MSSLSDDWKKEIAVARKSLGDFSCDREESQPRRVWNILPQYKQSAILTTRKRGSEGGGKAGGLSFHSKSRENHFAELQTFV